MLEVVGMNRRVLMVLLAGLAMLVSCATGDDPVSPGGGGFFTGITETDAEGVVGSVDPDDWCDSDEHDGYGFGPAYPNPISNAVALPFQIPGAADVEIEILKTPWQSVRVLIDQELPAGFTWPYGICATPEDLVLVPGSTAA